MAQTINGKQVSQRVKDEVREQALKLHEQGITPGLAVVIVGDNPASRVYVNSKKKACSGGGHLSEEYALPQETTQEELLKLVEELNHKEDISGILVQLPLPEQIDEKTIINAISPNKDDGCVSSDKCGQNYDWRLRLSALYTRRHYGFDCRDRRGN